LQIGIFARGLPIPSNPWPEGIDYLPGNLFAIPLKKLKEKKSKE
jgi:hypothetical protein